MSFFTILVAIVFLAAVGVCADFTCVDSAVRYPNPTIFWTSGDAYVSGCTLENVTILCDECNLRLFSNNDIHNKWQPVLFVEVSDAIDDKTAIVYNNRATQSPTTFHFHHAEGRHSNPLSFAFETIESTRITLIVDDITRMFERNITFVQ